MGSLGKYSEEMPDKTMWSFFFLFVFIHTYIAYNISFVYLSIYPLHRDTHMFIHLPDQVIQPTDIRLNDKT